MRLPPHAPRRVSTAVLCCVTSLAWLACGGDGGNGCDGPCQAGSKLQVIVTTIGPDTDPNGYTVRIEGDADPRTVQPNDTLPITGLEPGAHNLQLTDLAANCAVSGTNPKSVTILEKLGVRVPPEAVATFLVTCGVSTGSVVVRTTTTGDTPDPDGYRLLLDGVDQGGIGTQDGITLSGVTTSQAHEIALGGVDANCQLEGDNPQTVQVAPGDQAEAGFTISCQPPPPVAGALQVTLTTAGPDPDPDGYALSLDDGSPQAIGINATLTISGLSIGDHQLRVSGTADNCEVQGGVSRTVTAIAGDTAEVGLTVACTARPGGIEVTTSTTGAAAGDYTVALDNGPPQGIGANGSYTFEAVPAGVVHTVKLGGLTADCTPAGGAVQTVKVAGGQTSRVSFAVDCSPNRPPIAADDPAYQVAAGGTLTTDPTNGVLVNDSDPDEDPLLVVNPDLVPRPASAEDFQVFPNGGFRYKPISGFTGSAQFTYQAYDGRGGISNTATVTITVVAGNNSAPVANGDAYEATSGADLVIDGNTGVLSNDVDPEGDQLVAELVSGPTLGTLVNGLFPNGGFRYTPLADFTGVDQFTYQARDANGATSTPATVTITVVAGNSPPVASDDAYSMTAGSTLITDRTNGVLANDSDPDGDLIEVMDPDLVTPPANAEDFKVFPKGGFRYKPLSDFTGSDQFTYQARDPDGATSAGATVTITVNP